MSLKNQILSILSHAKTAGIDHLSTYDILTGISSNGIDGELVVDIHRGITELLEDKCLKIIDVPDKNNLQFQITPKGLLINQE